MELVLAAVKGMVSEKQYETGSPNRSFGTCGNLQSEILQTRSIRGHQHVVPTVDVFYLLENKPYSIVQLQRIYVQDQPVFVLESSTFGKNILGGIYYMHLCGS